MLAKASHRQHYVVLLLGSSNSLQHIVSDLPVLSVPQPEISSRDREKE